MDEYRESVDIDFLCASSGGYRVLRSAVFDNGINVFFETAPEQLRETRADRYGIRTVLGVDGVAIKFEVVREDRIDLTGELDPNWRIPVMSQADLYAEKLLANADRYADRAAANRDIIDLAMMIEAWGPIPDGAWEKVERAYGDSVERAFARAKTMLERPGYLADCLARLRMSDGALSRVKRALSLAG